MTTQQQKAPLENFLDKTKDVPTPDAMPSKGSGRAVMPFPTSYQLTGDQEKALVDFAIERLGQLEGELGRNARMAVTSDNEEARRSVEAFARSFMGKRELYELTYHNHVEWRPSVLGGIFTKSNLVAPLSRRIVRQMIARANNYFFSTDPWFAAYPVGVDDRDLADRVDRYTKWKVEQGTAKTILERSVELAFVRGECVVKTTHVERDQIYEQAARVLVDAQGKDILDANGDFIFESDEWIPENVKPPMQNGQVSMGGGNEAEASLPPQNTGRMILKKDKTTIMPMPPVYADKLVTRKTTMFRGPEAGIVYFKDFLCPLTASSVQEADCIVHLYDMPVMTLAELTARKEVAGEAKDLEQTQKAVNLIRGMAGDSTEPKAERNQPRTELGENQNNAAAGMPVTQVGEFYLSYDANGDGIMEEIMLVLDVKNRAPIFYDYTANVTPDGQRPFDVVKINHVDGRWYGVGAMEMFESTQSFVDLTINRINFSQSAAGRVTFWDPSATMEGDRDADLALNDGGTYTLKPGKKAEEAL
ncbi:MAG: portal protein, partial [Verrucomicrobiia bacterium]